MLDGEEKSEAGVVSADARVPPSRRPRVKAQGSSAISG
jgi:hypothetical protein